MMRVCARSATLASSRSSPELKLPVAAHLPDASRKLFSKVTLKNTLLSETLRQIAQDTGKMLMRSTGFDALDMIVSPSVDGLHSCNRCQGTSAPHQAGKSKACARTGSEIFSGRAAAR